MITTGPRGKQIRFDFDITKADNINNIPYVITPQVMYGTYKEFVGLRCVYRVNAINKNKDEVFGYLRECLTDVIEFGTKETDLPILIKFCSDAFINVEMDFQDALQLPYNIFGYIRPAFDTIGQDLLQQLIDGGYYN